MAYMARRRCCSGRWRCTGMSPAPLQAPRLAKVNPMSRRILLPYCWPIVQQQVTQNCLILLMGITAHDSTGIPMCQQVNLLSCRLKTHEESYMDESASAAARH